MTIELKAVCCDISLLSQVCRLQKKVENLCARRSDIVIRNCNHQLKCSTL